MPLPRKILIIHKASEFDQSTSEKIPEVFTSEFSVLGMVQKGKLGGKNLGKIFSEVSEYSENSEFSTFPWYSTLIICRDLVSRYRLDSVLCIDQCTLQYRIPRGVPNNQTYGGLARRSKPKPPKYLSKNSNIRKILKSYPLNILKV